VIDAGHGGYDRGGIPGQRVSEKDMTLDVARRLKVYPEASGYRVVMTRDSDRLCSVRNDEPQSLTPTAMPFLYPSTSIQRHEEEQAA
jgi:N-acetylmuramoyl-L-alanine amidase